jgi:hypothetical protein
MALTCGFTVSDPIKNFRVGTYIHRVVAYKALGSFCRGVSNQLVYIMHIIGDQFGGILWRLAGHGRPSGTRHLSKFPN